MGEFTNLERQTFAKSQVPTWDNIAGMSFDIMLVYVGINKHDAKLYVDPLTVKMEDIASPIDKVVWVND